MKKSNILLVFSAALLLGGCADSFEGSGSKDAASAEQLALRNDDPWDHESSVERTKLEGNYKDGEYVGVGQGMDGFIEVCIEIKDNKLSTVYIKQEGETQSVGGYEAIRDGVYAKMIDKAQGSDFDNVSGATITTLGVKQALDNALEQAK